MCDEVAIPERSLPQSVGARVMQTARLNNNYCRVLRRYGLFFNDIARTKLVEIFPRPARTCLCLRKFPPAETSHLHV